MKKYYYLLFALALTLVGCPDDDDTPSTESSFLEITNNTNRQVSLTFFRNGTQTSQWVQNGSGEVATFLDFDLDGDLVEQLNADSLTVVFDNSRIVSFTDADVTGPFNRSNYTTTEDDMINYFITEAIYNQSMPINGNTNNSFTIGGNDFTLTSGVRGNPYQDNPSAFATDIILYGNGISLDANNNLAGTGDLVYIILYGNNAQDLETGSYNIDDAETAGFAYVLYGTNFDIANDFLDDEVLFGTLDISRNGNTYTITSSGGPGNFSLSWEGDILLVP